MVASFEDRVIHYLMVRDRALEEVARLAPTRDPAELNRRERLMAQHIAGARGSARQGDLFTPDVRDYIRRRLARAFSSRQGEAIDNAVHGQDAPAPGAVPLEVNGTYPASAPLSRMPALLLNILPPLSSPLRYRIVGRDLILLDSPANLIVDFMRNALPAE